MVILISKILENLFLLLILYLTYYPSRSQKFCSKYAESLIFNDHFIYLIVIKI